VTVDLYQADQWHDYFITIGGAAAALTGLVFVAMSLNLRVIANDPTHRYRAVGTLAGFGAIFVICGLALMGGQDHRAVGVEWLAVSAVAAVVYVYGYVQAIRRGASSLASISPPLRRHSTSGVPDRWLRPPAQRLRHRSVSRSDFDGPSCSRS
jgi:drug/metabolite transporter (DMT)-like permease